LKVIKGNILFFTDDKDFNVNDSLEKVFIRGLGYGESIEAYVSKKIQFPIKTYK
tara:strand:+ start:18529 stop:18690 length:162 start_codon:yes stop_codon:yes gene_type:complete